MIPAAVSQTEIKIEMSWASLEHKLQTEFSLHHHNLMLVLVFRILRYWRMSGTVISLRALRNLRPIHVLSRYMETNEGGMVK